MSSTNHLKGKSMIVTGGASGIGLASVSLLLSEGAKVVIADINENRGTAVLEEFENQDLGERVRFFRCDVSYEPDVINLMEYTVAQFGSVDGLVNNASTGGSLASLLDTRVEDWDRTQDLVLRSVFLGIKHAAKTMISLQTEGSIVNMASIAAWSGGAGGTAYSSGKAAVLNLTKSAAVQLAENKIRVNAISPGTIVTPLLNRGGDIEEMRRVARETQPWPESGEPEHIAPIVSFLLSNNSRFITGENIMADGGASAGAPFIYSGKHPLGNAIVERIKENWIGSFDVGSTQATSDPGTEPRRHSIRKKKTVVITGVARGLGRALAECLMSDGHTVIGCSRSEESLHELRETWKAPHRFDSVDVSDDSQVRRWAESVLADHAAPDLLINNAAAIHRGAPLWDFSAEEFSRVISVNVLGSVNTIRHFLPAMRSENRGVIVNYSSGWGREVAPNVSPYCTSKWAVEGMTKALAEDLPLGMGAVSLHPGIINTDSLKKSFGEHAKAYPSPEEWVKVAAPFILKLGPWDNGKELSIPGMTTYRGPRSNLRLFQNFARRSRLLNFVMHVFHRIRNRK